MSDYRPPAVWQWTEDLASRFGQMNRPTAAPLFERDLPVGQHPFQLYSLGTPNGVKVTILFEELLAAGFADAEYDAWLIQLPAGEHLSTGFMALNPNGKIPCLVDRSAEVPAVVFESGAILLHLAEKFGAFIPERRDGRAQCLSWLFWQMSSAPVLGAGFGHFYSYAPEKLEYPINRFTIEVKRQLDVLNRQLSRHRFICGEGYTIADMAIWPWYGGLVKNANFKAAEFLDAASYEHLLRWTNEIGSREAVQRGRRVNQIFGNPETQVRERHDASDFDRPTATNATG